MMKLLFLIILAPSIFNATPVQDNILAAAVDDIDGLLHGREERSPDSTSSPEIPWYLDRIDQRKPKLDRKYNTFANGKTD